MPTTFEIAKQFQDTVDLTDRDQAIALVIQVNELHASVNELRENTGSVVDSLAGVRSNLSRLESA